MNKIRSFFLNFMFKKSWPILYSKLQYKMGQDFLDMQYLLWTLEVQIQNIIFGNDEILCIEEDLSNFIYWLYYTN